MYPDHRAVCLQSVLCNVHFVHVIYDWGCRLNYELRAAGISMAGDGNFVGKFDVNGNENELMGMVMKITTRE